MNQKRKLLEVTEKELSAVLAETKHQLVLDDFEDILELDALGRKFQYCGSAQGEFDLLGLPVCAGDVKLYRPGLGVRLWITEHVNEWFADDQYYLNMSTAFALTHVKDPEVLLDILTPKQCKKVVKRWWRTLTCTGKQLNFALDTILGVEAMAEDNDEFQKTEDVYGPIIAFLCHKYGATADYWMWQADESHVEACLMQWEETMNEQGDSARKMHQPGTKTVPLPPTPWMKRYQTFRDKLREIKKKWEKDLNKRKTKVQKKDNKKRR